MEAGNRYPDPAPPEDALFQDTLTTVFSLLCAVNHFYAADRNMLAQDRNTPRRLLLDRIASRVESELTISKIGISYAPALLPLNGVLNMAIRSRKPGKNPVVVNFTSGKPDLDPLREICGSGPDRYLAGIGIALNPACFQALWLASEEAVRSRMELYFPRWTAWASFFAGNPPPDGRIR